MRTLLLTALLLSAALPAQALMEPSVPSDRPLPPSKHGQAAMRAFNQMDWNTDGRLNAPEAASARAMSDRMLLVMDRNGDGRLTEDELRGNRGTFRQMDRDRDGLVTGEELKRGTTPALLASLASLRPGQPPSRSAPPPPQARAKPDAPRDAALCNIPLRTDGGLMLMTEPRRCRTQG